MASGEHLLKSNLPGHAQNVALWKSTDFDAVLEKARIEKQVTLWHIAVAPMVSARMWRDLVYAYAEQMRDAGRLQDAASMLVTIQEIEEAVDMLLAEGLFREAVCIVRCHLSEEDPLQRRVFMEWAKHAELVGDFELAAHCYIGLKDFERAARSQGHRKDSKSLDLAVALAKAAGNETLAFTLGEQTIQKHTMERSYGRAMALATEQKELQPWIWLIVTHEEIMKCLEGVGKSAFAARNVDHWLLREDSFAASVTGIVDRCTKEFSLTATEASVILNGIDGNPKTKHEVQLSAAAYIAASLATKNEETKLIYLVKAFEVCYRYHIHFPRSRLLLAVIMFAMPSPNMERRQLPTGPNISIGAFICAGLIRWMDEECSSTLLQEDNDDQTSAILQKIITTIKYFLPCAFDTRAMFYYNAISQYGKYEKLILEQKKVAKQISGNVADEMAVSVENVVHAREDDDSFENGLSELSLDDEFKKVSQCPISTLKRLRKFELFFNKTRVAAPNPLFFYMDLKRVLTQYQEKAHVQELLEILPLAWKKTEAAIADIWTMVLHKPVTLFGSEEEATIITEFWDAVQIRDQEDEF